MERGREGSVGDDREFGARVEGDEGEFISISFYRSLLWSFQISDFSGSTCFLNFERTSSNQVPDSLRRIVVVEMPQPPLPEDAFDRCLASLVTKKRFPKLEEVVWISALRENGSSSWSG